jgi:hypothetical protein
MKYPKTQKMYRIQNSSATKLMYIKLPLYLFFFIWRGLNYFDGANLLLGPLEGVGPSLVVISGPKKSRFSGLIPANGLKMDFPPSKFKIITSCAI